MTQREENTSTFTYYNANPKGVVSKNDAPIRAICTALGQTWKETLEELTALAIKNGHIPTEPQNYKEYLQLKGWVKHDPIIIDKEGHNIKVAQFAQEHPEGIFIINVYLKCLSVIIDGKNIDTRNFGQYPMGSFWTKEG